MLCLFKLLAICRSLLEFILLVLLFKFIALGPCIVLGIMALDLNIALSSFAALGVTALVVD